MSLVEYMDHYNIKKTLLTTINKAASAKVYASKEQERHGNENNQDKMLRAFEKLKNAMPKGQLDHQDVVYLNKKYPGRFYPMFWFNPKMPQDLEEKNYEELKKHFQNGFIGVKLHPGMHLIKIPRDITKLAPFLQECKKILYIHSTPKVSYFSGVSCKDIAKLANNFPDLKIIVGHAGYAMEYCIELGMNLKKFDNVYFETSCSIPYAILSLIKTIGHERILFGSDAPITNPVEIEITKITCLPISEEQKQDIFYNNTDSLLRNM
jgi:hypothetical protein